MAVISIYGRPDCGKCHTTENKVAHFLKEWGTEDKSYGEFAVVSHDMSTANGMAEGLFFDVWDIPATIISDGFYKGLRFENWEIKGVLARWDGIVPDSEYLRDAMDAALGKYMQVAERWERRKPANGREKAFLSQLLGGLKWHAGKPEVEHLIKTLSAALDIE
jgi:hypothetical protein